jgi:hypothetical protein
MRWILCALALTCCAGSALAAGSESLVRFRRDPAFYHTGRLQTVQWVNPAAADTDAVASDIVLGHAAVGTHSFTAAENTNFGQSVGVTARTISCNVTSKEGTAASVIDAGTITITGRNLLGDTVTEAFTIEDNTEVSTQGAIAFSELTTLTYTAMGDTGAVCSIGIGTKLGLWNTLPIDSMILAWNGSSADASAAFTVDDDEIEKNVVDFSTDPTGTSDCGVLYWVPPFAAVATEISSGKY